MDDILTVKRDFHIEFVNKSLMHVRFFLTLAGIWPEGNMVLRQRYFYAYFFTGVTVLILQIIFLIQNSTVEYITGTIIIATLIVQSITKALAYVMQRDRIMAILNDIRYKYWPVHIYQEDFELFTRRMKIFFTITTIYLMIAVIAVPIWVIFPFATVQGERPFPVLIWTPFDLSVSPTYELMYCWMMWASTFIVYALALDIQFAQIILYICYQYELINSSLRKIRSSHYYGGSCNDKYIYDSISFYIKHHVELANTCSEIRDLYNITNTFAIICTNAFCLTILLFLSREITQTDQQVKIIFYATDVFIQLCIYCVCGTLLEYHTETIGFAAYDNEWYETSPAVRMSLLHIMQTCQRPQKLTACGLTDVNNITFIQIVKAAFSVSTLLRNSHKAND